MLKIIFILNKNLCAFYKFQCTAAYNCKWKKFKIKTLTLRICSILQLLLSGRYKMWQMRDQIN